MAKNVNDAWGGRFSAPVTDEVAAYTDSQHYDRQIADQDIRASKAHAAMLGRQGIITPDEAEQLIDGLELVRQEIAGGRFVWKSALEDVHMNIEGRLCELIGDVGKKLHTGRSRNDQVGLSFRLYVSDSCSEWLKACLHLCATLLDVAENNRGTILPGYTHMQPAQPVSLAQHMLAYAGMIKRDALRLSDSLKRIRISPLGAAALAGAAYPLDPDSVAREVGFDGIYENSMDAVSDRDFVLEALFDASLIMAHLSRLCEEIIIWANPAFGFIRLPDQYSTGSSIMPQKKNPDVAELMRGKCGRVYGDLMAMLTMIKGLPLAYDRDMQEDKEGFFDASRTVLSSLRIMSGMLAALTFNAGRMREACKTGFLNATELADYLARKGVPFREAHHIAGKAVRHAEDQGKGLEDLSLTDLRIIHPLIEEDVYQCLDYETCVATRETPGGTGPKSVCAQIRNLRTWLESFQDD